ncbi:zinc finger CCCH domain-containing protein 22-like [Silene latifolia]|uniref:zinc finger CCCH domain-containing protein 22-like n=1 Tax=Silene latifolia TaxID=37657 RepID=UPI003D78A2BF
MAEEEERVLEEQLEVQLQEHKDSVSAIKHALIFDPDNAELLSVEEELISSIKDAEEGLLGLKRARLLREADAMQGFTKLDNVKSLSEDVLAEHLNPTDVEAETLEEPRSCVGSKCRFRHTDGRWHNGQIVELKDSCSATVSFLTPMSENTMMCKFFLQQRCRFGANCRLSHGTQLPLSSLKKYVSPNWGQSHVGATILAVSKTRPEIWRNAELKSWDNENNRGVIVFRDDGSSEMVGNEAIALSQRANSSDDDDESDYLSHDGSSSSDSEEDRLPQGLGFVETTALQRGVQTDTSIFATWENHTRGVASKMMANMGYREGMGLGSSGQGMVDPIPVKVLPPKQSLDHALRSCKKEGSQDKKKRSRGGKRKRDKKFAEAARAAKQEEEKRPDVFSLINSHLATHSQMFNNNSNNNNNSNDSSKKLKSKENKKEDRRSLIAYEEEAKELRVRVEKLEEMVNRNRKEKAVYEAAMRKLSETRKALAEIEARHASASNALTSKDREKKWLRF